MECSRPPASRPADDIRRSAEHRVRAKPRLQDISRCRIPFSSGRIASDSPPPAQSPPSRSPASTPSCSAGSNRTPHPRQARSHNASAVSSLNSEAGTVTSPYTSKIRSPVRRKIAARPSAPGTSHRAQPPPGARQSSRPPRPRRSQEFACTYLMHNWPGSTLRHATHAMVCSSSCVASSSHSAVRAACCSRSASNSAATACAASAVVKIPCCSSAAWILASSSGSSLFNRGHPVLEMLQLDRIQPLHIRLRHRWRRYRIQRALNLMCAAVAATRLLYRLEHAGCQRRYEG